MSEKTHWKKNNDSRYISGEDLMSRLKGLKPEMHVVIDRFEDAETFDQTTQSKSVKTGFFLKELNGESVYKPVILNNTNAKFCVKEFGSDFMEDWLNKPLVVYAMPDKRHGFVARFKKYYPPSISDVNALTILNQSTSLIELQYNWSKLNKQEQALPTVMALKDKLKNSLA
jgi:hypothetical protein